MRLWEFVRAPFALALGGLVCLAYSATTSNAQDILPSSNFDVDSGNWTAGGSWDTGAPDADTIAVVNNRGLAQIGSDAGTVHSLSLVNGSVELGSGGSLEVANQAIVGPAGTLSYAGGSLTAGSLAVSGTIDLSSEVATDLTLGSSWEIAKSANVFGQARDVTIDGLPPVLGPGLSLEMIATDTGASVQVETLPFLQVNRETGDTSIVNLGGGPVAFKGYSVLSSGENIDRTRGRWKSLEDQEVEGWVEANPERTTRVSELNLLSSTTLAVGESFSIGNIYVGLGNPPSEEDLRFEFLMEDERVLNSDVQYTGPINDLVLRINPESGEAILNFASTQIPAFEITAIGITSSSGSILPDNYAGIGEDGWRVGNPKDTSLTELTLDKSKALPAGTSLNLGNIFNTEGSRDLRFEFGTLAGTVRTGTVLYEGGPTPGDCNNDGVVNGDDLACVSTVEERDIVLAAIGSFPGDFDGIGGVNFDDFLKLSANFEKEGTYADGNADLIGPINFDDFLVLSANFGMGGGGGVAAVPEPNSGFLFFLGVLGMMKFRRRIKPVATVAAVAVLTCAATAPNASAEDFDARFIRLHPNGPNSGLANVLEALSIVEGHDFNALLNEDITGTIDILDFSGGDGGGTDVSQFDVNNPYLNGVNDDTMSNFLTYVSGVIEIPQGEYTIGCGSDDGCIIRFTDVDFEETYNENGPTVDDDGEIIFNGGRGHDWTFGTITVPSGGVTTGFEAIAYEGGGGDSFEIGVFDEHLDPDIDPVDNTANRRITAELMLELEDGVHDWNVTGDPFVPSRLPGDFNGDGKVDEDDAETLIDAFGDSGVGPFEGDMNLDGVIDFKDASLFAAALEAAQGQTKSVPEPTGISLALISALSVLFLRKRKR